MTLNLQVKVIHMYIWYCMYVYIICSSMYISYVYLFFIHNWNRNQSTGHCSYRCILHVLSTDDAFQSWGRPGGLRPLFRLITSRWISFLEKEPGVTTCSVCVCVCACVYVCVCMCVCIAKCTHNYMYIVCILHCLQINQDIFAIMEKYTRTCDMDVVVSIASNVVV